jgi:hypothetical protein
MIRDRIGVTVPRNRLVRTFWLLTIVANLTGAVLIGCTLFGWAVLVAVVVGVPALLTMITLDHFDDD